MESTFKSLLKATQLIAIIVLTSVMANAQGNPGGPGHAGSNFFGNGNAVGGSSPTVPFDGGMSLLLAASGIGYAAKKIKKKI